MIEPEQEDDHQAVRRVVAAAFAHHPEVADLVELIRASPQYEPGLALVARRGREVVGHVMISHAELVEVARLVREVRLVWGPSALRGASRAGAAVLAGALAGLLARELLLPDQPGGWTASLAAAAAGGVLVLLGAGAGLRLLAQGAWRTVRARMSR